MPSAACLTATLGASAHAQKNYGVRVLFYRLIILCLVFLFSTSAHADVRLHVDAPDFNLVDNCSTPPSNGKPFKLTSVEIKTADKAIGIIRQGDKAEMIYPENDLKDLVGDAVVGVLKKCGYKFSDAAATLKLRIDIDEFGGSAGNKFFIGKGETRVAISLVIFSQEEGSQQTIRFDRTSNMKGFSTKKLGRLSKTLKAALQDILKSVAESPAIPAAITDLSKFDM